MTGRIVHADCLDALREMADSSVDAIVTDPPYGLSKQPDMAEVLGCSIGTVESRLFRARKRFKDALERQYPELVPQTRGGRA